MEVKLYEVDENKAFHSSKVYRIEVPNTNFLKKHFDIEVPKGKDALSTIKSRIKYQKQLDLKLHRREVGILQYVNEDLLTL